MNALEVYWQNVRMTADKIRADISRSVRQPRDGTCLIVSTSVGQGRITEAVIHDRAVAGSAAYDLGLGRRGLTAQYTQGSFDTKRMLLLWGPSQQNTHTFAGAELFDSAGFGQNRGSKRGSAMAITPVDEIQIRRQCRPMPSRTTLRMRRILGPRDH